MVKNIIIKIIPYIMWLTITMLVIFFRVFGNDSIILPIYIFSTFVCSCILMGISGLQIEKYINDNFGNWDNFKIELEQTYNLKRVPSKYVRHKIAWFAFKKIDFGNEKIKNLKWLAKSGIYLAISTLILAIPLSVIFMILSFVDTLRV